MGGGREAAESGVNRQAACRYEMWACWFGQVKIPEITLQDWQDRTDSIYVPLAGHEPLAGYRETSL